MLLVMVSLVQLIWNAYFLIITWKDSCSFHRFEAGDELTVQLRLCQRCTLANVLKNVGLCYAFTRRLVYLTNRVHALNKQVSKIRVLLGYATTIYH